MAITVSIELVSSSAKSAKGLSATDRQTIGPIDWTLGTPGSDTKVKRAKGKFWNGVLFPEVDWLKRLALTPN